MGSETKTQREKVVYIVLILISSSLSIGSFLYFYTHHLTLSSSEAIKYLNYSRRFYYSLISPLVRMGELDPPLFPFLMLPLIWKDSLWQSGIAGYPISLLFYLLSSLSLYKSSLYICGNHLNSFLGTLLYLSSPLVIYLQSLPLPALMLATFLTISFYFLIKWIRTDQFYYLVFVAFMTFLGSFTGYEGWVVAILQMLIIIGVALSRGYWYKKLESHLILYGFLPLSGIIIWIIYTTFAFGSPFYFIHLYAGEGILSPLLFFNFPTFLNLILFASIVLIVILCWLTRVKGGSIFLAALLVLQIYLLWVKGPEIFHLFQDKMKTKEVQIRAGEWLSENYDGGMILCASLPNDPVIFFSHLDVYRFITEHNRLWKATLGWPPLYAKWVVTTGGDVVSKKINPAALSDYFILVWSKDDLKIYRRKKPPYYYRELR